MKRTLQTLVSTLLFALIPTLLLAEPPGRGAGFRDRPGPGLRGGHGPGGGFLPPPGYLDLTAEQKAAAEDLREQARAELEPLHEQVRTQWEQLRTMLDADNPDATAVGQRLIAIHQQRDEIRTRLESYGQRFAALLTPEQLAKWENFKELRHARRPGHDGPPGDDDSEGEL